MTDTILVVVTIGFFALCWCYVIGCESLMRMHDDGRTH